MKTITNFIFSITLFVAAFSSLNAQEKNPALVLLPDMTGYSPDTNQLYMLSYLHSSAEALRAALPEGFQSAFAVYDFGYYSHHLIWRDRTPEIVIRTIEDWVTHPYYLILGREMDRNGIILKVWLEMELPWQDFLSCLSPSMKSYHKSLARRSINPTSIIGMNFNTQFVIGFENAMNYLVSILDNLKICCEQDWGCGP